MHAILLSNIACAFRARAYLNFFMQKSTESTAEVL